MEIELEEFLECSHVWQCGQFISSAKKFAQRGNAKKKWWMNWEFMYPLIPAGSESKKLLSKFNSFIVINWEMDSGSLTSELCSKLNRTSEASFPILGVNSESLLYCKEKCWRWMRLPIYAYLFYYNNLKPRLEVVEFHFRRRTMFLNLLSFQWEEK